MSRIEIVVGKCFLSGQGYMSGKGFISALFCHGVNISKYLNVYILVKKSFASPNIRIPNIMTNN